MKLTIEITTKDQAIEALELLTGYVGAVIKGTDIKEEKKTPVKKPKKVAEPVKAPEPIPEPVKEVKEVKTATETTLADLTTLAKATVATAGRDAVKDLVASFSTTAKLSDVPTEKFSELVEALKAL